MFEHVDSIYHLITHLAVYDLCSGMYCDNVSVRIPHMPLHQAERLRLIEGSIFS